MLFQKSFCLVLLISIGLIHLSFADAPPKNLIEKATPSFEKKIKIQSKTSKPSIQKNKKQKLPFVQRLILKMIAKRLQKKWNQSQVQEKKAKDERKTERNSLVSFILGVLSLFIFPISVITAILAIIFGSIGMTKINYEPNKYKGKGFAIAGLVLGIVSILVSLLILLFLLIFWGTIE